MTELVTDLSCTDPIDWRRISENFPSRNAGQCQNRWETHLSPDIVKGPWTKEVSIQRLSVTVLADEMLFLWYQLGQ